MRFVLILFFLFFSIFNSLSQSNNYWNIIDSGAFSFNNSSINLMPNKLNIFGTSASICNSKGKPLLYTDGAIIKDGNNKSIINSDTDYYFNCILTSLFIPYKDSLYYLIQQNGEYNKQSSKCNETGLFYTKIYRDSNNDFIIDPIYKKKFIKHGYPSNTGNLNTCRNENGFFNLCSIVNDSLLIFKIEKEIKLINFYSLNDYFELNKLSIQKNTKYLHKINSFFNHFGNKIYIQIEEDIVLTKFLNFGINDNSFKINHILKIIQLDFDKNSAKISNPKIIWEYRKVLKNYENILPPDSFEILYFSDFSNPSFSLNDSFLYLGLESYKYFIPTGRPYLKLKDTTILLQINTITCLNFSFNLFQNSNFLITRKLKQNNSGSICLFSFSKNFNKIYFISDIVEKPNKEGTDCNYKKNFYSLQLKNSNYFGANMYHFFDFIRLNYKITYNCNAEISFENNSFAETKFSDYTWFIYKQNGKIDTLKGTSPVIIIEKSGKYPYKVFGYSSSKQYGEWFEDTLFVNIPAKPISKFQATDTVICRYLPLKFYNFSNAEQIKPGTQEKYLWTFGDGSTSTEKEPTHTYTQPGYYTVSLFYSNGYCDSTLVKNQYIHVTDAPRPGFIAKQTQGCVPFTAEITDTVKLNVTRKEYLFGDTTGWREITGSQIKHTFTKPGHYWAVQKLYGFTGCVIRTDSVKFYISKGVMPDDSIKITSASFDTLNNLALEWQKHHAAVRYDIYRSPDGTNYNLHSKTKNLNYTDSQNIGLKYYYKVKAIDSCGKTTQYCNIASPHIIKGIRQPKNESADISHTQATGLGNAENIILEYTSNYAKNLAMLEKPFTNPYHDADFAIPGYLQKCYRLQAEHSGIKVYSNLECINYEPIIYIPNSFSPNTDGLNEEFAPVTTGIVSYEIRIYNRWGEEIYKSNKAWKAQNQEAGIYFYNIKFIRNDRQTELHSGVVHLIR